MKRPAALFECTWPQYLEEGIELMEGATAEGVRDYHRALDIFNDCVRQEEHVPVRVEAQFRIAQLLHYQNKPGAAGTAVDYGRGMMSSNLIGDETRTQCRLIELIVEEERVGRTDTLLVQYQNLYKSSLAISSKLAGDIAQRIARCFLARWRYEHELINLVEAGQWNLRALSQFMRSPPSRLVDHARVSAASFAGLVSAELSRHCFRDAKAILRRGEIWDRTLRRRLLDARLQASFVGPFYKLIRSWFLGLYQ